MGHYTLEERKEEIIRFLLENFNGHRYIIYSNLRNYVYSIGADLDSNQQECILRETIRVLEAAGIKIILHESFLDKVVNFFLGDQ